MKSRIFFITLLTIVAAQESADQLCSSFDAQQSCGQCIKAHAECAWCIDPHSSLTNRCQLKSKFTNETCTPHLVYSPQTAQVKIQQNLPLETKQHDGKTIVRQQPQAVSVRLMPSHSATVSFKYLHQTDPSRRSTEPETMEIQTSDVKDTPLQLKFFIVCDGELKETKSCRVQNNQIVEFKIEEINSRLCHQNGHLVCGQCVCDQSRGGDKCECPLASHGVSKASELEDKCRFNSSSPVCSASGKCKCGQCQCNKPTAVFFFWDTLHIQNSITQELCSNNGRCECNRCVCNMGKTGAFCGSDEKTPAPEEKDKPESVPEEPEATEKPDDMPSDSDLEKELDESSSAKEEQTSSSGVVSRVCVLLTFFLLVLNF
nr:hypothetical protein C05D9.3 - Caenorhabditis elegans [Caenorhabditis elegans]